MRLEIPHFAALLLYFRFMLRLFGLWVGLGLWGLLVQPTQLRAQLTHGRMRVDGKVRTWLEYAPREREPEAHMPLLIALHRENSNARAHWEQTGWNFVADTANLLVIFPNGWPSLNKAGKPDTLRRNWNAFEPPTASFPDDERFLMALVDSLKRKYDIDTNRVYVTGMGQGSGLAFRLACERNRVVSGVAVVNGRWPYAADGKMPGKAFICRAAPGLRVLSLRTPSQTAAEAPAEANFHKFWMKLNGCDTAALSSRQFARGDTLDIKDYKCGLGQYRLATVRSREKDWFASATGDIWSFFVRGRLVPVYATTNTEPELSEEEALAEDPANPGASITKPRKITANKIAPQPAGGQIYVYLLRFFGPEVRYTIFDNNGSERQAGLLNHQPGIPIPLKITGLKPGQYRLVLRDELGNSWQCPLIKSK